MPSDRKQTAFRLSDFCLKQLDRWAKQRGHSRTAVIETLVREEAARKRRYSLPKKEKKE